MPPVSAARWVTIRTSSSKTSLSLEEAPPEAFQASTLRRMYPRVHGVPFLNMTSAASGKKPAQRRFTKALGGRQSLSSPSAHAVGSSVAGLSSGSTGLAFAASGAAVGAGGAAGGASLAPPQAA